jgi:hypothetical protein
MLVAGSRKSNDNAFIKQRRAIETTVVADPGARRPGLSPMDKTDALSHRNGRSPGRPALFFADRLLP